MNGIHRPVDEVYHLTSPRPHDNQLKSLHEKGIPFRISGYVPD